MQTADGSEDDETREADPTSVARSAREKEYWSRNLRYLSVLLAIWFAVSYGAGILFAEPLNQFRIPGTGFPVGFWFAQQGSIYVFVVLIFVYVYLMNHLDREFDVDERAVGAMPPDEGDEPPGAAGAPRGGPAGVDPAGAGSA